MIEETAVDAAKTFEKLEFGNLDLNYQIEKGILLVGLTKTGKTTSSHHLARQQLEGFKNSSDNIVYRVRAGQQKFRGATIGNN